MTLAFAPGCALLLHKPGLADRILEHLRARHGEVALHLTCCHHEPGLPAGSRIINVCPGCDRRYRSLYPGIATLSLWELLAEDGTFPWPDHGGAVMAIHDACPTRTEDRVLDAVRALCRRMNVRLEEPAATRDRAICCGDSFIGTLPRERVLEFMARRAEQMPCQDVVVYCVSCVKAMHNGGRRPRHLVDLLFGEDTPVGETDPEAWQAEVKAFIETH